MTATSIGDALRAVGGLRAAGDDLSAAELTALADLFRAASHPAALSTARTLSPGRRAPAPANPFAGPRVAPAHHTAPGPKTVAQPFRHTTGHALQAVWRQVARQLGRTGRTAAVIVAVQAAGAIGYVVGMFTDSRWLQRVSITAAAVAAGFVILLAAGIRVGRAVQQWRQNPEHRVDVQLLPRAARSRTPDDATRGTGGDTGVPFPLDNLAWKAPRGPAPLLAPRTRRAVLLRLAATRQPAGVDVEALAAGRARREPLGRLPHLQVTSVRRGVQVLLERGPALEHLRSDTAGLLVGLRDVVGRHATRAIGFEQDPEWITWPDPAGADEPWPAPTATVLDLHVPLIVVTDFGLARTRRGALPVGGPAWASFDRGLARRGCRARYLVAYPRPRWPQELQGLRRAVPWADDLSVRVLQPLEPDR